MGRSPCCDKLGLKKGPWTPEEDQKLLAFIEEHGHGNWRALPIKAGLQRCGKSCRLRWTNYLRPDIKRGKFSLEEEKTIIQLHALLGNKWSAIATHLPKRTDNEIKNYWNTHLKKRLAKKGIDPVTHRPKNDALLPTSDGQQQSKNTTTLSHMAQWESARLEAEARLARLSKLQSGPSPTATQQPTHHQINNLSSSYTNSASTSSTMPSGLDVLKSWHSTNIWPSTSTTITTTPGEDTSTNGIPQLGGFGFRLGDSSPTSTLSFSENGTPITTLGSTSGATIQLMDHNKDIENINNNSNNQKEVNTDDDGDCDDDDNGDHQSFMDGFTELLLRGANSTTTTATNMNTNTNTTTTTTTTTNGCNEDQESQGEGVPGHHHNNKEDNNKGSGGCSSTSGSDYYEDNKNYWNSILNLVNSSPSASPMF